MAYTKQEFEITDYFGILVAFAWFGGITWLFTVTFIRFVYSEGPKPPTEPSMRGFSQRDLSQSSSARSSKK